LKPTDFAYHLTKYLTGYLPGVLGARHNTVLAYRDTFKLLLRFEKECEGVREERLSLSQIDKELILRFLLWIENERGCSISTRNVRLAAIHAFFSYLQGELPDMMYHFQGILSIPMKKHVAESVEFLSADGVKALLAESDVTTKNGRKHLVLLSFMFATGCRVQEVCDVRVADAMYNENTVAKLTGKGAKSRFVPLDSRFVALLRQYISEFGLSEPCCSGNFLFTNHMGNPLTRQGVTYVLKKYAQLAREKHPSLIPEKISPHVLRHSRAINLLRAGVDLIYIRDILGHASVQTTEIYARVDGEMKRKALEEASGNVVNDEMPSWQQDKSLMEWLKQLN
jgi:site-specific recombinase XerD